LCCQRRRGFAKNIKLKLPLFWEGKVPSALKIHIKRKINKKELRLKSGGTVSLGEKGDAGKDELRKTKPKL